MGNLRDFEDDKCKMLFELIKIHTDYSYFFFCGNTLVLMMFHRTLGFKALEMSIT